jgi:hypothetical protein
VTVQFKAGRFHRAINGNGGKNFKGGTTLTQLTWTYKTRNRSGPMFRSDGLTLAIAQWQQPKSPK